VGGGGGREVLENTVTHHRRLQLLWSLHFVTSPISFLRPPQTLPRVLLSEGPRLLAMTQSLAVRPLPLRRSLSASAATSPRQRALATNRPTSWHGRDLLRGEVLGMGWWSVEERGEGGTEGKGGSASR